MEEKARKTGIGLIGGVPWGTHFCQFYQTKDDLIDVLVPYFKAGLKNNEFCMWVTSEPLNVEDAKKALKKKVKGLDDYIKKGQIEILDYNQWYTKSGGFNSDRVLQGWVEKEKQALEKGFDGLRLTGNTFWLEEKDWRDFTTYEAAVNSVIGQHRMLAVCTYSLDKCRASEILDVVSNHQFALIRREGEWKIIASAERKETEEALRRIEWLLTKRLEPDERVGYGQAYGNLVDLNSRRVVADAGGEGVLATIVGDYLDLLETSAAVYEKNGDYALGIFTSGWCRMLDEASRNLCGTDDNSEALASGKWHCHESCWTEASKVAIETREPSDIECRGGIRLHAIPIWAGGEVVGAINFGYGDPPKDPQKLQEIAERYAIGIDKLVEQANAYECRPPFVIDIAKKRLGASANLIGSMIERKQAEEELRESEERYRAIFAQAADSIVLVDPQNGAIVQFNDRAHESLGYTREELQKLKIADFEVIESAEEVGEHIEKIIREGGDTFETKHRTKGGEIREILVSSRVISIGGKDLVQSMWHDITERKDMEAQQIFAGKILERLNQKSGRLDLVRNVLALVKESTGFEAVGIRLREGDDFPYFIAKGFPAEFIEAENYLCARDDSGKQVYDSQGNTVLECMCGSVLSGRTNPALPFFTESGSFWTNSTTKLLASTSVEERMGYTRNRCNTAGYESLALIPLRSGDEIVGLLQLNDRRPGRFTPEMIRFFEGICASIGIALARIEAEEDVKNLAKFPSENPNAVLRITKDGVLLYANDASESLLTEWGCDVGQVVPEKWRQMVSEVFASKSGRKIEIEHARRIFSFVFAPVVEADYVNLYGRDITERKKAQETLEASEEQFRRAVLDSPFPIMIHAEDGEVLQISKVWTDLTGYTPQEIPTLSAWTERAYGDRKDIVKNRIDKIFDYDKRVEEGEYVISSKDGKTLIWDFSSAPLGKLPDGRRLVISMAMDITERKQAEEQVRNLAKFPSENPYPVLRIAKDGTILYANSAGSELLEEWGCEVGAVAPEHWCQYILRILRSESSEELEVACRDRIFSLMTAPVVEAGYVNIYGIDITERKRAEEDLRKYRHHLEELVEERTGELTEANKQLLEEVEGRKRLEKEILNISEREQQRLGEELHDSLGQQLTGVAFMTKVLEQKLTAKSLNEAADVAEIAKLVNQATAQARGLARGLHPVDLDASSLMSSLEELAASMEQLFGVRCTFKCDKPVEVDDAEVAVHLYRIAQEAVTNAIKHSRAKNIRIGLAYGRNKSVMTVKSDGLDFPKEFEARGTGMGLQIMDHRADIIGGSLDICKAPKGGTIVTCEFPSKKRSQ